MQQPGNSSSHLLRSISLVVSRLHNRTPGDGGLGSYLDWAQREWNWFAVKRPDQLE